MTGIRISNAWAPVPNAFVETAPTAMIGQFSHTFGDVPPEPPIYIRPGQQSQQDLLNDDGAEWVLYTRSVMSYSIRWGAVIGAISGAALIVEQGSLDFAGVPQMRDTLVFHLVAEDEYRNHDSGIELDGIFARFKILTALSCEVAGSIIVRAF